MSTTGPPVDPAPHPDPIRRRFLKAAGLLGAAAAAAGAGLVAWDPERLLASTGAAPVAPAGSAGTAKHQWVFIIDMRKCDGCKVCTEACQQMHYLTPDQEWIKVYKREGALGQEYFMPRVCMMCENPPCVRVCPVKATYQDAEGIVLVDQDRCIGCRMCMAACPYEARTFNWGDPPQPPAVVAHATPEFPVPQQKGTAGKCVFCIHNLRAGKMPACIESCSMNALYVGDWSVDLASNMVETVKLSTFLKDNNAIRFKEELNTRPRVYYILGHGEHLEY